MSQEIVYTSAPKGLKPGSRGFCTVIATQGMARNLAERLESLSGYRHAFAVHDENAHLNPVNYSHLKVTVGGQEYSVLSRICDAGQDYTGRTNKLAHHVALTRSERPPAGPAYQLQKPGFCVEEWDSQTRYTEMNCHHLSSDHPPLTQCTSWSRWCDAGWAGVLAQSALEGKNQTQTIIFPVEAGSSTLALVAEALQLLPEKKRWDVTFSTYFTKLPAGVDCQWRFVLDGTPEADAARRNPRMHLIDLCADLGTAPEGTLIEAARTGQLPQQQATEAVKNTRDIDSSPTSASPVAAASPKRPPSPPPLAQHFQKTKSNRGRSLLIGTGVVLFLLLIVGTGILLMPSHNNDQEKVAQTTTSAPEMKNKQKLKEMEQAQAEAAEKKMQHLAAVTKVETPTIEEPPQAEDKPKVVEVTKTTGPPREVEEVKMRDTYLVFGKHQDLDLTKARNKKEADGTSPQFTGGKLLVLPMSHVTIHLPGRLELTVHEKSEIELPISAQRAKTGNKAIPTISLRFGRITLLNRGQEPHKINVNVAGQTDQVEMIPLGFPSNIPAELDVIVPLAPSVSQQEQQKYYLKKKGNIILSSNNKFLSKDRKYEAAVKQAKSNLIFSREIISALSSENAASSDPRSEKYYRNLKRIMLKKLDQAQGQQKAQLALGLGLLGEVDPVVQALMQSDNDQELAESWPEFIDVLNWQLVSLPESDQAAQEKLEEQVWQAVNRRLTPEESIPRISELRTEYEDQLKAYHAEKEQAEKKEKPELPQELEDAWSRLQTAENLLDLIRGDTTRLKKDTFDEGGTVQAESVLQNIKRDIYFEKILQYGSQQLKVGDYLSRALVIWNLERITRKQHTKSRFSNPSDADDPKAIEYWINEFDKRN
ncbi:hypothetical protein FYZ48_23060 [Gimesia chilikensis]|uniref:GAP1-N2 domain-containing protein n=1 Tax=Gimesia chilikensis TaxID=2605989 RepID=UPI0011ECCE8A|nr:hypothetical protein [Gimesia chilikensis]KAA0133695.1 hypothetical protein FYZ48_23060 [Gimesia chilikensis]